MTDDERSKPLEPQRPQGSPETGVGPDQRDDAAGSISQRVDSLDSLHAELQTLKLQLSDAQKQLKGSRGRYATLFEQSPVGYVTLDNLGRIEEINLTTAKLLAAEREALIGMKFRDFVARSDKSAIDDHLRKCCQIGQATSEIHLAAKDGRETPVELRSFCSMSSDEPGTACRMVITDISERLAAQEQRRQMEDQVRRAQMLESLNSAVDRIAHDFNDFLMVILGNTEMAARHSSASPEIDECLGQIKSSALQARSLTRQMLTYAGKGKCTMETVDLNQIVSETAGLLKESLHEGVELRLTLADELPAIEADASQIRQLVKNLLGHASDSLANQKGQITVQTSIDEVQSAELPGLYSTDEFTAGSHVVFKVSDTGPGLDQAARDALFRPSFTTRLAGPGLGLSAVIGIVRGHGGAIKVDSELGQGTTFSVYFPYKEGVTKAEPLQGRTQPTEIWQATGQILIADDEPTVLDTLRRMCIRLGFSVHTAQDGAEAVEVFQEHSDNIVAVLLDYEMPGMSCEETFERLQQIRPEVPVILSSGYAEEDTAAHLVGKGLAGFIQKPYELEKLSAKLQEMLRLGQ